MCGFHKIFTDLAARPGKLNQLVIDAIHLKTHRNAGCLLKKRRAQMYLAHQRRPELQATGQMNCSQRDILDQSISTGPFSAIYLKEPDVTSKMLVGGKAIAPF
jgi:hypothetical protein